MSKSLVSVRAGRPRLPARLLRVACLAVPLAAGAAAPTPRGQLGRGADFFDDARFAPSTEPLDPADVFKLSPEMLAYIDDVIVPMARAKGVREGSPTRCTRAASCSSNTTPS